MDNAQVFHTKTSQETIDLGRKIGNEVIARSGLKPGKHAFVIALFGDLGAGKTTFLQGFAKSLGINGRLLSPTFIIVRRYTIQNIFSFFYHMDLYRVDDIQSLRTLGIDEICKDTSAVVAIEWADHMEALPSERMEIYFTINDDQTHTIKITSYE